MRGIRKDDGVADRRRIATAEKSGKPRRIA